MCNKLALVFLTLFIAASTTFAGPWGPGGCAPVGAIDAADRDEWVKVSGTEYALYRNGVQIGNYDTQSGVWRTLRLDGTWGPVRLWGAKKTEACKCSQCKCTPCKCTKETKCDDKCLFGVESDKLHKDGVTRHYINGRQVPRREAVAALTLSDDSTKPFVTFIGQGREALAKAFASTPEAQFARVNSYSADSWYVRPGFVTNGTPTVYVQRADGVVTYRNTDGKAPDVDTIRAEVRKVQPNYDSSKDPNGSIRFDLKPYYPYAAFAAVAFCVYAIITRK